MRHLSGMVFMVLAAGLAGAQASPAPDQEAATPEALRAEVEALRQVHIAWRGLEWRTCLLGALQESAREKKPIFLWVLGGAPADGRC
jgi:hypothetical protein